MEKREEEIGDEMKCNVLDLSEEGKKYEVRFFQRAVEDAQVDTEGEKVEENTQGGEKEDSHVKENTQGGEKVDTHVKSTILIDPNSTTKIEYYETPKKKPRNWFMRTFMCCA